MTDSVDTLTHARAMLDIWRASGDDRVNRTRVRLIDAMARRASAVEGEARRVLDARVSALIDAHLRDIAQARVKQARVEQPHESLEASPGPLAALLDDMKQRNATHAAPDELLDYLRAVYSKVSAEKRVRESLEQVPKNAGPLNSSHLVHRSLSLMREVSPDYLEHFLGYLDALAWLEEMVFAGSVPVAAAKKTGRVKAR